LHLCALGDDQEGSPVGSRSEKAETAAGDSSEADKADDDRKQSGLMALNRLSLSISFPHLT
jgi:hypothetical protein